MISTITSKGQITLPKPVREQLKLSAGDKVEFIVTDNGQLLLSPVTASVKQLKGMFPPPNKAVSLEQMDEAIAQGSAK
jgi:AbrB family looped-hinge helix DNA binding protein